MYVLKINQLLKLRKFEPIHNNNVGSIIKHYRKKSNLTLEETADDICSISYLSKLENNMILPSDKFVEPILNRLGLSLEDYNEIINPPNYEQVITSWLQNSLVNELKIQSGVEINTKINNYLYYVNHHSIEESNKIFNDLILFGKTMQPNELAIFIFSTAYLVFIQGRYYEAFKLLTKISKDLISSSEFNTLKNIYLIKCAFNLSYHSYINHNHNYLIKNLLGNHHFEIIKDLEYDYIKYLIYNDLSEEKMFDLINKKRLTNYEKNSLLTFYYYVNNEYQKAWNYLSLIKEVSEDVYIYQLLISNKLNLINHKQYLERPRKIINENYQLIVEYYQTKHYFPKRVIAFLRQSLIYNKKLPQTKWIIYYWYLESIPYFTEKSFYKAASTIMKNLVRQLKSLTRDI